MCSSTVRTVNSDYFHSIVNRVVFITETECVSWEVRNLGFKYELMCERVTQDNNLHLTIFFL